MQSGHPKLMMCLGEVFLLTLLFGIYPVSFAKLILRFARYRLKDCLMGYSLRATSSNNRFSSPDRRQGYLPGLSRSYERFSSGDQATY